MNRRRLIIGGLQATFGATVCKFVAASPAPFKFSASNPDLIVFPAGTVSLKDQVTVGELEHLATVHRMIAQSGRRWAHVRDRSKEPALIYFGKGRVFEVSHNTNREWQVLPRDITSSELSELKEFQAYLSQTHYGKKIGDRYQGWRVRAWIKDGRRPGWNVSIEGFEEGRKS